MPRYFFRLEKSGGFCPTASIPTRPSFLGCHNWRQISGVLDGQMALYGIAGPVKGMVGKAHSFSYNRSDMRKDAPLAFRIPTDLKKKLQEVAKLEARSISQTCEIFLRLGVEGYEKEGSKFLQRFLSHQKKEGSRE